MMKQKYVQQLSDQHLNVGESFQKQNRHALLAITDAVSGYFIALRLMFTWIVGSSIVSTPPSVQRLLAGKRCHQNASQEYLQ